LQEHRMAGADGGGDSSEEIVTVLPSSPAESFQLLFLLDDFSSSDLLEDLLSSDLEPFFEDDDRR